MHMLHLIRVLVPPLLMLCGGTVIFQTRKAAIGLLLADKQLLDT